MSQKQNRMSEKKNELHKAVVPGTVGAPAIFPFW